MSDLEFDGDSDEEVAKNHSQLIDAVRQLDKGQRVKKPERTEPSLEVSEFHLVKSGITDKNAINIDDLAKTLGKQGHHAELNKKLKAAQSKSKVLRKPLEKPAAAKIKRKVGFENTKEELKKWTGIVANNRTAACVSFPLTQSSMRLVPSDEYTKRFRLKSELEKQLEEVDPPKEPAEEKDEFPLTVQEILERRKEAAKFRAQQSYKVAKAHRQKKIKSKKYHRIQRKEKIKKTLKEFEELQKTDPQAALEKLDLLDKARAEERMTLRHKSTGQWAKSQQIRAKYDKDSRQVLAEQLAISRELVQKVKNTVESDESDDENNVPVQLPSSDKDNPWMNPVKTESEIDDFLMKSYARLFDKKKSQLERNDQKLEVPLDGNKNMKDLNIIQEKNQSSQLQGSMINVSKSNEIDTVMNLNNINSKKSKKKRKKSSNLKSISTSATSTWNVSPADSPSAVKIQKNLDIDEMFDEIEDSLQDKVQQGIAKAKRKLAQQEKKTQKNIKRKQKQKKIDDNDIEALGLKGQRRIRPIIDKSMDESTEAQPSNAVDMSKAISNAKNLNGIKPSKNQTVEIDPNKFMVMKPKHIRTMLPDDVGEDEAMDDKDYEEGHHQIISEAFADDDVVDDFRKEKEEEIKKSQPEPLDLTLPGWGSWGGKNLKISSRKRRQFIVNFPNKVPRRDENKGDVVIIEEKCPKIKQHLVNELPFPFNSVQDYEASIRAPVGRDFVPEKSFSKLITPHVKTKMGEIIEPMSEEVLVKKMKWDIEKKEKTVPAKNEKKKKGPKVKEMKKQTVQNEKQKKFSKVKKMKKQTVKK